MISTLLFPGIPGAVELIILLLLLGVFLVVPVALIVGAYLFGKRRGRAEAADEATDEGESN